MAGRARSDELDPAERVARWRLARTRRIGPITFQAAIARFGTAVDALRALPDLARRAGTAPITPPSAGEVAAEEAALARLGARAVVWGEPAYPVPLAALPDAPPVLAIMGDPATLARPAVAVVGARNASANGRRLARMLAGDLGAAGLVVVSGLARGIDAAAHEGALATGTVAVMAGGLDIVYPEENRALHGALTAHPLGAVVSELPPGVVPRAEHFPRRNRIVAGLSLGVVVVEAALRSGSLITARLALEQGREVFAVPGSPLDPRARGANDLLRAGATLVESAEDVLAVLAPLAAAPGRHGAAASLPDLPDAVHAAAPGDPSDPRPAILERLGPNPVSVDELSRECQLSVPIVAAVLLEFELAGRLERHPGHKVSLVLGGTDPR